MPVYDLLSLRQLEVQTKNPKKKNNNNTSGTAEFANDRSAGQSQQSKKAGFQLYRVKALNSVKVTNPLWLLVTQVDNVTLSSAKSLLNTDPA